MGPLKKYREAEHQAAPPAGGGEAAAPPPEYEAKVEAAPPAGDGEAAAPWPEPTEAEMEAAAPAGERDAPGSLTIYLEAGFAADRVQVWVADRLVYDEKGVATDYSIGLADRIETEVGQDPAAVVLAVPSKHLSAKIDVAVSATPHLRVNIVDGEIRYQPLGALPLYF
jgi:hypothetical protein